MPRKRDFQESFFTSKDAAELLGISRRTLQNWLKTGLIPEPQRNPLTQYRKWTEHDLNEVRRIISERNIHAQTGR